jgi:uncharacterized protein (TIGR02145 family)
MAENLRVSKYNDGTAIPLVTDGNVWATPSTSGYCWYNNEESGFRNLYGALYNWFVLDSAINGGKNVCPAGWHVPNNSQWTILTDFLVKGGYAYGKSGNDIAKSMASSSGWTEDLTPGNIGNNQAQNNSSGFDAPPSGYRDFDGTFDSVGGYCGWWSSMQYDTDNAWSLVLIYCSDSTGIYEYSKQVGFSVRCIMD